ncbi:hypothetical protein [Aureimonas altamirensis]|uniref:hypothetical protein n=1 Tax=Aureimonas altamirensis TaxID=370622 RepID=UPI002555ADAD|nr:hypothetical protein [Aureimonas altamirensis]
MAPITRTIGHGIARTFRPVIWGMRMGLWLMLTFLRRPMVLLCGLITFSGWIGGMLMAPALLAYGNAYRGSDFGWQAFVLVMGVGLVMGLVAPAVMVKYDALLFRIQPQDRQTIYY